MNTQLLAMRLCDYVYNNNVKTTMYSQQQVVGTEECKSPCPSSAEMCIEICA